MVSPVSSPSSIGYRLLPPDSNASTTGFSFTIGSEASVIDIPQVEQSQNARICCISKSVMCNICVVSTACIMIVSGSILATSYHEEIPGIVITIAGFALSYFPVYRLMI